MVARTLKMPNVRELFIPDPGMVIAEADLTKADLHVVVWEADDAELKQQLANGTDVYREAGKVVGLTEYGLCKRFIHLTNYGGSARTCGSACGLTTHNADKAQRAWFGAHPGIKQWHDRTRAQLEHNRTITNAFGYHRMYFDRISASMLREALAWVPQSTVACVTNRAWVNIEDKFGEWLEVLLQVHDSLLFQYPWGLHTTGTRNMLLKELQVVVPYDDPLVIPWGLKSSPESWGAAK